MMKKIIKFTLLSVLILVVGFVLGVLLNGINFSRFKEEVLYSDWMKNISDETYLNDIVIPGSHDAGSYDMVWLGETQKYTIKEQLNVGVRYFDIRVNYEDDEYVIFHSIINGVKFIPILNDIKEFITNNPTEVLLLDFQHFSGNSQNGVYNLITEYLYNNNLLVVNETTKSDLEFINSLKLKDVRGKCIIFWGDRSSDLSNYVFLRNNDNCSHDNMSLNSYYESSYHENSDKLFNEGYELYFNNIVDKINKEGKGIFVLQGQLTDLKLIFGPWSKEKVHNKLMNKEIDYLKTSDELKYLNVIMRDFIDGVKCKEIINLNYYKNNMSEMI